MNKENENCVQEKLNNFVLEQPWSSLSFTGKVRKMLLKSQNGLKKVFCNKVFSLRTIWFLSFILLMLFLIIFVITFYFYTDYVYEEVTIQSDRKLSDQKQVLSYVQYLNSLLKPLKKVFKHKHNVQTVLV